MAQSKRMVCSVCGRNTRLQNHGPTKTWAWFRWHRNMVTATVCTKSKQLAP